MAHPFGLPWRFQDFGFGGPRRHHAPGTQPNWAPIGGREAGRSFTPPHHPEPRQQSPSPAARRPRPPGPRHGQGLDREYISNAIALAGHGGLGRSGAVMPLRGVLSRWAFRARHRPSRWLFRGRDIPRRVDNPEDKPVNHVETLPSGRPFVTLRCSATSSAMSSALKLGEIPALAGSYGGFVTPLRPRRALGIVWRLCRGGSSREDQHYLDRPIGRGSSARPIAGC